MGKQSENCSLQNHSQSSSKAQRRTRQGAECTWASLKARKAPRGDPYAGATARWSSSSNAKKHCRRTSSTILESAGKELDALAVHMPNLSDSDARTLALRMFYIEVSNGMSAGDAEANVSQMFLVSPRTVQRGGLLCGKTVEKRDYKMTMCDRIMKPNVYIRVHMIIDVCAYMYECVL